MTTVTTNTISAPKVQHKAGNWYLIEGGLYILAIVNPSTVQFINVSGKSYWRLSTEVRNPLSITEDEFTEMIGSAEEITLVDAVSIKAES